MALEVVIVDVLMRLLLVGEVTKGGCVEVEVTVPLLEAVEEAAACNC